MIRERRAVIQSLISALATKPFVMLAGISGSGKTQLARRIAAGLAAGLKENGRFSGKMLGGEVSGPSFRQMLISSDVVPSLEGEDGNEYVDVHELGGVDLSEQSAKDIRWMLRDRVAFLPVRPDWADSRKVWGYYNPLTGLYYPTDAMRVATHAYLEYIKYGDAAPRHFIVLDELNLARVEYYLSDLLSLMECPAKLEGDRIRMGEFASVHPFSRPLWSQSAPQIEMGSETSSHEQIFIGRMDIGFALAYHYLCLASSSSLVPRVSIDFDQVIHGADWARIIPPRVTFTPNLCIIGTVNVDETTFSLAPKVLDRAFVLEFNEANYEAVCSTWPGYDQIKDELAVLYTLLRPSNQHFGYRVVNELLHYLASSQGGWAAQGDFLLTSKVLPKLRGGEDRLGSVLPPLLVYSILGARDVDLLNTKAAEFVMDIAEGGTLKNVLKKLGVETARYPMTADKVYRMTRQLLETGLTSFF